jgi:hypothetical protein
MLLMEIIGRLRINAVLGGVLLLVPTLAFAKGQEPYTIVIKDHQFDPVELIIPAGKKIKLVIDNQDPTPEEFESYDLNREKVVTGHRKIIIYVGPLKPGSYKYFGEFHQDTAQGIITATEHNNGKEK